MKAFLAYTAIVLLGFSRIAFAQITRPSDLELHTMYCISLLQEIEKDAPGVEAVHPDPGARIPPELAARLEAANQAIAAANQAIAEGRAQLRSVLHRLWAYLAPRMGQSNIGALGLAIAQAKADERQYLRQSESGSTPCFSNCASLRSSDFDACSAKCPVPVINPAFAARLSDCENPTWLPF